MLDHKEGWIPKNSRFQTVVLKTLENPLNNKEIKPVNLKGNQSWIFIGRADAEAPILWLPDAKNCLIWKDPDSGNDWGQEEKGTTEVQLSVTLWTAACQASCPSPSPGTCSNSCPLGQWCRLTISSSVAHFSSCLLSYSASRSLLMSWLFASGDESIGVSASASVLSMNIQGK